MFSNPPHPLYAVLSVTYIVKAGATPLNVSVPKVGGFVARTTTYFKFAHRRNASSSILSTLFGMVTDANFMQPRNAPAPILVTLFGIVTEVNPVDSNAASPILLTLFEIVTEVKPVQ